jgi:hypothetical protein
MEIQYDAVLPQVLTRLFPEQRDRETVEGILSAYGTEMFHREIPRVKMAVLKMAGGDLDEVTRCMDIACRDYRDVLCAAEYPNQSKRWSLKETKPDEYEELIQKDLQQYQEWIDTMISV